MLEGCLAVLIMAAVYLGCAVWLERRTRPETSAEGQTTSERGLHGR